MENILTPGVRDSVRTAAGDAQKLGKDIKAVASETAARGRELVDEAADDARGVVEDIQERARVVADKAKKAAAEGREKLARASDKVTVYADEHTAIVALSAFGVGLLLGALISRRR